ncbi:hypothetical protein V9T40_012694 [Parthenolecanium corni]|uniref:Uncharacterized protein n=1 Tax=Parthenolecanium corni TaxID=536013 RepID=A0AAN9Y0T5_9HEMI
MVLQHLSEIFRTQLQDGLVYLNFIAVAATVLGPVFLCVGESPFAVRDLTAPASLAAASLSASAPTYLNNSPRGLQIPPLPVQHNPQFVLVVTGSSGQQAGEQNSIVPGGQ